MAGAITKKLSFDLKGKRSDKKCNGSVSPNIEPTEAITEKNDSNSEKSSISDRKIVRRSSLICSSGKDKFTFDSEHADVPVRSVDRELNSRYLPRSVSDLSSRASVYSDHASSLGSDGESSPVCKRDSVVHPGYDPKTDLQRSLCIDGRFQNPWPTWRTHSFTSLLKFGLSKSKSNIPTKTELDKALPIEKPDLELLSKPPVDGVRVTWLGHATVLIQFDGVTLITDPMFSDRASPSQIFGPKRFREPPCTIHELPRINAVLISHTHYDHLDLNSVTLLNARFGAELRWYVPCGLTNWLRQIGCENVIELDWWEESLVPDIPTDVCVVFTPAQHWCKRTVNDDNKVLWGSWCVIGPRYKFFFAGDTGYCDAFKQIGRMFGPFDLSAIPIGAYEPRWFMKYAHVNPEDAVKIHQDVRSKRSVAIHWGTFSLANEYYLDPPIKLREALDEAGIPFNAFFTLNHGETKLLENKLSENDNSSSLSLTSNDLVKKTREK